MTVTGVPKIPRCSVSNTAPNYHIGNPCRITIDWLTLVQEHTEHRMIGSNLLMFVEISTGELVSQAVKSLKHEGSFSSFVQIRSDGHRVEVSGNPSRWGEAHSLDGLTDLRDAVELWSDLAEQCGLPRFFAIERDPEDSIRELGTEMQYQGADGNVIKEGMRITRIDLAQLHKAGSPDAAEAAIRAFAQVSARGKSPVMYGQSEAVAWGGGSRHCYVKYYCKGVEMLKRGTDQAALLAGQWARSVGLIRHEVELKSMWLVRNGLYKPAAWTAEVMARILGAYAMHERVSLASTAWSQVYERLLALGVKPSRAERAQEALYSYLSGHRFRRGENISQGSYYRLKSDLRLVGVDIGSPLNVSALPTKVRVIELSPVVLPEFCRRRSGSFASKA